MPTYLCSRTPKSENSKRLDSEEEFWQAFQIFTDSKSDEVLRFEFNKRYYVEIAHARNGFYLNCYHEQHFFETDIPFDGVKTGFTIEEFLDDFWHHRVRQKYNFDEEVRSENFQVQNPNLTARLKLRLMPLIPLLLFIPPALLYYAPFGMKQNIPGASKFALCILLVSLPYWILYLRHFIHSLGAELQMSDEQKLITLRKRSNQTSIHFSEITQIRIISNDDGSYGRGPLLGRWSYMRIVAGPYKRIVVSDLLHEDLLGLANRIGKDPVAEPSFYPFLLEKKKSQEDVASEKEKLKQKTAELEERWASRTKDQLEEVITNSQQYSASAVEAAKRLLKRKKG